MLIEDIPKLDVTIILAFYFHKPLCFMMYSGNAHVVMSVLVVQTHTIVDTGGLDCGLILEYMWCWVPGRASEFGNLRDDDCGSLVSTQQFLSYIKIDDSWSPLNNFPFV